MSVEMLLGMVDSERLPRDVDREVLSGLWGWRALCSGKGTYPDPTSVEYGVGYYGHLQGALSFDGDTENLLILDGHGPEGERVGVRRILPFDPVFFATSTNRYESALEFISLIKKNGAVDPERLVKSGVRLSPSIELGPFRRSSGYVLSSDRNLLSLRFAVDFGIDPEKCLADCLVKLFIFECGLREDYADWKKSM